MKDTRSMLNSCIKCIKYMEIYFGNSIRCIVIIIMSLLQQDCRSKQHFLHYNPENAVKFVFCMQSLQPTKQHATPIQVVIDSKCRFFFKCGITIELNILYV